MKLITLVSLLSLSLLSGCNGENADYLFHETLPVEQRDKREYPLSLLEADKNIDVLLVIDNSGSMGGIQQSVIKNARLFFEKFAKQSYINWKVGLISTDERDDPYIGFDNSLDYTMVDFQDPASFERVISRFQGAVSRLGTNGSASEYTFYNVKRVLDLYDGVSRSPRFLREKSHLVVIMLTDEEEQSKTVRGVNPQQYEAPNFYNELSRYINSNNILRFYGAFNHKELKGCENMGSYWNEPWKGNAFDQIISLSQGFYISPCTADFGKDLARIGQDIVSLIGLPSLLLRRRPLVETLKVFYKGELLPAGPKDEGGFWFYEEESNTINFYDMDFVDDFERDHFVIDFEVDDGIRRKP